MSTIAAFTVNPLLIGLFALSVAVLVLTALVLWMYFKLHRFLVGIDSDNISDSLVEVSDNLSELQKFRAELETYLHSVEKRLKKSVQTVRTVRFNPFKGEGLGGNQSFVTAFLNEEGDGVLISSLHARDHVRVFSKPVKDRQSDYELSEEEVEALAE